MAGLIVLLVVSIVGWALLIILIGVGSDAAKLLLARRYGVDLMPHELPWLRRLDSARRVLARGTRR